MPLNGPSFLAHQGNQSPDVLEEFLREVRARQPGWRVGATCFLPRYVPGTTSAYLASLTAEAAYGLTDPDSHKLDDPFDERGRGRHALAYLQESDPVANRTRFVRDVLEAQVAAGAQVLISPWLTHGVSMSTRNFRSTIRFAEDAAAHPAAAGRTLLFGFAATEDVIKDTEARDDLLDAIVELPPGHIYFRMRVTPPTSYAQYADDAALRGLRAFVEGLAANGRHPVLAQIGLAGWLATAFGAIAFGSGINASMQRYIAPADGWGTQPLEWYFCPQLLGYVLRTDMPAITALPEYERCDCPWCPGLPLGVGGAWNPNDAGRHYLWWCARLLNEMATAATPAQALRDRLAAAEAYWQSLQQNALPLDPRSEPRHLAAWSAAAAA